MRGSTDNALLKVALQRAIGAIEHAAALLELVHSDASNDQVHAGQLPRSVCKSRQQPDQPERCVAIVGMTAGGIARSKQQEMSTIAGKPTTMQSFGNHWQGYGALSVRGNRSHEESEMGIARMCEHVGRLTSLLEVECDPEQMWTEGWKVSEAWMKRVHESSRHTERSAVDGYWKVEISTDEKVEKKRKQPEMDALYCHSEKNSKQHL